MPQQELQQQRQSSTRPVPKEPRRYRVIILNDDFTTFEFVVDIMVIVFQKTRQEAWDIAETTHVNKRAVVGTYSLDIARSKVAKATSMARSEGFPLKFDIEPE
ncbi:MAG: ATP-dependent Clp protease adaptor ClpS [Bacteroidales bacterium]|nr:ATP-dependent Clp protease adaptor ClpS [Bacteroidales bacterium]